MRRSKPGGPTAAHIKQAAGEATAALEAASQIAARAEQINAAVQSIDVEAGERRLATLDSSTSDAADLEAARRSLAEQRDTAARMERSVGRLVGQMQRLVAQLGEAAARAEELALGVHSPGELTPGLTHAIDGLVAIRKGLDTVDILSP